MPEDDDDRKRPGPPEGDGDIGKDTDVLPPASSDGLLSHFVKRIDTGFHGRKDKTLIGEDVGWAEDELDEDGEPLNP